MIVLLTGGAANGKSRYAERLAAAYAGSRTYVATMRPDGEDGLERIRRHRRQREGLGFQTLERQSGLTGLSVPQGGLILLECVATWLDNEWFARGKTASEATAAMLAGIRHLASAADVLIVVTNRIEAKGRPYDSGTLAYIETMAALNETLTGMADAAVELVAGLPLCLKGRRLLLETFPGAPLLTAVITDPFQAMAETRGMVLALSDNSDTLSRFASVRRPVLGELDDVLETCGNDAFALPFSAYALILSRFRGTGVIPLSAADRRRRERAGRLLIHIAGQAARVIYEHDAVWLEARPHGNGRDIRI